jgi:putative GTP pyrophosphokinase
MIWMAPQYSKREVNKAGEILVDPSVCAEEREWAASVLSNWRSSHSYPINTFQATLRQKLKSIDPDALISQRLKRIPSIIEKLRRYPTMKLARMQDIGGLRAVVRSLRQVGHLYGSYKSSRFKHVLLNEKDYVDSPKESGYRSIHLVYRYRKDSPAQFNGLIVELQIRTRLQHAWATAVETMGTFLQYSLKSSEGPEEWLEFFALTSSAFAHLEQCNPVPGYASMSPAATYEAVSGTSAKLQVVEKLSAFRVAVERIVSDRRRGSYYLLILDPIEKTVRFKTYSLDRLAQANEDYLREEQQIVVGAQKQVVLVAADSVEALKRAYPSFFLDTHEFLYYLDYIASL